MDSPVVPDAEEPTEGLPAFPRISDYWPDAPHRIGPPADHYELPGVDATRTGPALRTRPPTEDDEPATRWIGQPDDRIKRDLKPALFLAAVTLLVGAGVFAAVSYARSGRGDTTTLPLPPLPAPTLAGSAPATAPVSIGTSPPPSPSAAPTKAPTSAAAPGGAQPAIPAAATFELADGVTQLRVTIGDVPSGFFRIGVGEDSTIDARAAVDDGTVRVTVTPNGRKNGSARLEVLLSDDVKWSLRMRGGVREAGIDLSGGRVGDVDLIGGAATVDLVLPGRRDTIPVTERGGIGTWRIVTDGEVPVRAFFREGAGAVTLYGDTTDGVDKGETLRFGKDPLLKVDSEGGVGALTVQAR